MNEGFDHGPYDPKRQADKALKLSRVPNPFSPILNTPQPLIINIPHKKKPLYCGRCFPLGAGGVWYSGEGIKPHEPLSNGQGPGIKRSTEQLDELFDSLALFCCHLHAVSDTMNNTLEYTRTKYSARIW